MGSPKKYVRANIKDFGNIPEELRLASQWECWKITDDNRKIPINPHSGQVYPRGLTSEQMGTATYGQACACFTRDPSLTGIGFRFKKADAYTGIDVDDCRDLESGALLSWAADLAKEFNSYYEISPSGTGIKLIARGSIPKAVPQPSRVEMYSDNRYFALTGLSLNGNEIRPAQKQLTRWYELLTVKKRTEEKEKESKKTDAGAGTGAKWPAGTGEHYKQLLKMIGGLHRNDPQMGEDEGVRVAMGIDRLRAQEPYPETKVRGMVHDIWAKKDDTKESAKEPPPAPPKVWESREFLTHVFPSREPLVVVTGFNTPVFTAHSINQIFAKRGTGKSMLAMTLAGVLSTGGEFLNWKILRPTRVLYIDGELPDAQIQSRMKSTHTADASIRLVTLDSSPGGIPSLATAEGQEWVENILGDAEVLVGDSIASLAPFATNDEELWMPLIAWLMRLRSRGLCIVLLHQAGKAGLQRGHSRGDDALDIQIKLEARGDEETDHLLAELTYEKIREQRSGVRALTVSYNAGAWTWSVLETDKLKALEEYLCLHPKATTRTIAKDMPELGSYITISRLLKKLK
jgi:hypothetical protein